MMRLRRVPHKMSIIGRAKGANRALWVVESDLLFHVH